MKIVEFSFLMLSKKRYPRRIIYIFVDFPMENIYLSPYNNILSHIVYSIIYDKMRPIYVSPDVPLFYFSDIKFIVTRDVVHYIYDLDY